MKQSSSLASIVLAAGKGTRMRSELPKVLHQVCGYSLIRHVLNGAHGAGVARHYVVVGHGGEIVEKELSATGMAFVPVWQKEQKGTGHAVQQALPKLQPSDQEILILAGDCPLISSELLGQMVAQHRAQKADLTLGVTELANPFGYGRVITSGKNLKRIVEEKEASPKEKKVTLVNGGVYVLSRSYLEKFLPALKPSKKTGELYLTDIVAMGAAKKKKLQTFYFPFDQLSGVNDMSQLAEAEKLMRKKLCLAWMLSGVRLDQPESLVVDCSVSIESGASIGPNVVLQGKTLIGAGARVEAGCVIKDSTLEEQVLLKAYSHLEQARVNRGAEVGPFARLRPEALIGKKAKIGNFVEIKKSTLGEGSKVSHLSYVGDAEIGKDVNVGCGFIACNYDGVNKHKTTIEDGVFVGSGVQAVAPIVLGKDSYVATGTTLTKNVPSGALAIARVKQDNKEGYAERLKSRMQAAKKSKEK